MKTLTRFTGVLGALLFLSTGIGWAQLLWDGDASDIFHAGSHQIIITQVGDLECRRSTFENGGNVDPIHGGGEIPGGGMSFPGWKTLIDSQGLSFTVLSPIDRSYQLMREADKTSVLIRTRTSPLLTAAWGVNCGVD